MWFVTMAKNGKHIRKKHYIMIKINFQKMSNKSTDHPVDSNYSIVCFIHNKDKVCLTDVKNMTAACALSYALGIINYKLICKNSPLVWENHKIHTAYKQSKGSLRLFTFLSCNMFIHISYI